VTDALAATLEALVQQLAATSALEFAAVALGFIYIMLAIRRQRGCWIAGALSTALYVVIFLEARLYLQSALQVAYVALAVYGWRQWSRGGAAAGQLVVRRWAVAIQARAVAVVVVATLITAPVLARWSDAAAPWPEALGTWASVVATWMMARRVTDHWLWWIVIDVGLAALFASQGLVFTALLYLSFAVLAAVGFRAWRRTGVAS
jgi:nicotinamide mononucleotide transporter